MNNINVNPYIHMQIDPKLFTYELNTTLKLFPTIFRGCGLKEVLPLLQQQIDAYATLVGNSATDTAMNPHHQLFGVPIDVGIAGSADFYYAAWEIDAAIYRNCAVKTIDLSDGSLHSREDELEPAKVKWLMGETFIKPIVVAAYSPIEKQLVIDGNHRFHAALNRGDRFIQGIVLSPEEHYPYLLTNRHKLMYIIHHNLSVLRRLINGQLAHSDLKLGKNLNGSSFYDLSSVLV